MLYYDSINISEGINPTKSNRSRECMIRHYFFFNLLKNPVLENLRYIQKNIVLNFSLFKTAFFTFFVWYI